MLHGVQSKPKLLKYMGGLQIRVGGLFQVRSKMMLPHHIVIYESRRWQENRFHPDKRISDQGGEHH